MTAPTGTGRFRPGARGLCSWLLVSLALACTQQIALPGLDDESDAGPDGTAHDDDAMAADEDGGASDVRGGARDAGTERPADGGFSLTCNTVRLSADQENPRVVIALDRSLSMLQPVTPGGASRLQMVQKALSAAFKAFSPSVHFGYEEFPVQCSDGGCCASEVVYPPSPNAVQAIEKRFRCEAEPSTCYKTASDSPSHLALHRCKEFFYISARNERGTPPPRYVLLITDDDPGCAATTSTCSRALDEIADLGRVGVKTVVVGVSEELRTSGCLDRMAATGGAPREGSPSHHLAPDETQLNQVLNEVLNKISIAACRFRFDAPVTSDRLMVSVAGQLVRRDPARQDGWEVDSGSGGQSVTIFGPACDRLRRPPITSVSFFYALSCTRS